MAIKPVEVNIDKSNENEPNYLDIKEARMKLTKDLLEITFPVRGLPTEITNVMQTSFTKGQYIRLGIPRNDLKKVIQELYMS